MKNINKKLTLIETRLMNTTTKYTLINAYVWRFVKQKFDLNFAFFSRFQLSHFAIFLVAFATLEIILHRFSYCENTEIVFGADDKKCRWSAVTLIRFARIKKKLNKKKQKQSMNLSILLAIVFCYFLFVN